MTKKNSIISEWGEKTNWTQRVKAICKPCWELKYCPYGPLVEDFPIKDENDDESCRIFGHDCPVFYVAQPLTETKEFRRISRTIPRTIQFKVIKRENQICRECGKPVLDEDINFDHIIPWSKGGPTEEHNIRLLCSECNKKRGNRFEDEYLVKNFTDHVVEPSDIEYIDIVKMTIHFGLFFLTENKEMPNAQNYADEFTDGEISPFEHEAVEVFRNLYEFFTGKKPSNFTNKEFKFLKTRWGFVDNNIYKLAELIDEFNYEISEAVKLDKLFINRMGIRIKDKKSDLKKWGNY
ncbi:MAG: endonuclease [Bacteroidetes bacterium]|nr:endonuclease [Bacteroidota bacterium]